MVQAQAVAVQQAQQQGSGLAAGLAALGYGGSPLGALGSPAQLQTTGTAALKERECAQGCMAVSYFIILSVSVPLAVCRTVFTLFGKFYHACVCFPIS